MNTCIVLPCTASLNSFSKSIETKISMNASECIRMHLMFSKADWQSSFHSNLTFFFGEFINAASMSANFGRISSVIGHHVYELCLVGRFERV